MYTFSQKILKNYLVKPPPALGKTNVYADSYKYYVSEIQVGKSVYINLKNTKNPLANEGGFFIEKSTAYTPRPAITGSGNVYIESLPNKILHRH